MALAKKKKKFFDIDMPLLGKETQLYSFTPEELNGRMIKYDLTRLLRGKNAIITLDVHTQEGNLTTIPRAFRILPTFLRKMVRKGTSYVEDSFVTDCKDKQIEIKPFLIARRKVSRAVRKALRDKAREEIITYVKTRDVQTLFKEILKNQFQKPLSIKLKKTYPLALCEIRAIKILGDTKKKEKESTTKETSPEKKGEESESKKKETKTK